MKTQLIKISFIFFLFISNFISAMNTSLMETVISEVKIIDQNEGGLLEKYFSDESSIIGIFGATPRYSFFARYQEILKDHLAKLVQLYMSSKRMKGVSKDVKNTIKDILEKKAIKNPIEFLQALSLETQYEIFLNLGLNQKLLNENISVLINTAISLPLHLEAQLKKVSIENGHVHLIHCLMPCYFNDISIYLSNQSLNFNILHNFLKVCALFYKKLYQNICNRMGCKNISIYILIPSIEYFKSISKEGTGNYEKMEKNEKVESLSNLLHQEIIAKLSKNNLYILLNLNAEEMKPLVLSLCHEAIDIDHIGIAEVPIFSGFSTTNRFNPYILKREKEYPDFKQSPLITPELLSYFEQAKEKQ